MEPGDLSTSDVIDPLGPDHISSGDDPVTTGISASVTFVTAALTLWRLLSPLFRRKKK